MARSSAVDRCVRAAGALRTGRYPRPWERACHRIDACAAPQALALLAGVLLLSSAGVLALGAGAREGAHFGQGILPAFVSDWTADLPLIAALHPPSSPALVATHAGVALGVAAAVTAARRALLGASPEFREATNRSNAQVLRPLRAGDVVTVSLLPAVAEETAFRGVLLPALMPAFGGTPAAAYGAVVASGAVFGALHAGGGRNAAFAAWASLVGVAYGAAAVATGDVATAMLAHALANYASATLWLRDDAEASIV